MTSFHLRQIPWVADVSHCAEGSRNHAHLVTLLLIVSNSNAPLRRAPARRLRCGLHVFLSFLLCHMRLFSKVRVRLALVLQPLEFLSPKLRQSSNPLPAFSWHTVDFGITTSSRLPSCAKRAFRFVEYSWPRHTSDHTFKER